MNAIYIYIIKEVESEHENCDEWLLDSHISQSIKGIESIKITVA